MQLNLLFNEECGVKKPLCTLTFYFSFRIYEEGRESIPEHPYLFEVNMYVKIQPCNLGLYV